MADPILAQLLADTPRAPHFIVTIYGDVVEPRGGSLWMGTLIETCAQHGISESLVRTAVSRLVTAGRLEGVRLGRRSYYRLSERAQAEFRAASRILFAPPPAPDGWLVAALSGHTADLRAPWTRLGTGAALAPSHEGLTLPGAVVMRTQAVSGDMPALAAQNWPLDDVAKDYRAVLARYGALAGERFGGAEALALRLRLVDDYRSAALADPRLPRDALPRDWPAEAARGLFVRLYLALTEAADRHVATVFADRDGALAHRTEATVQRIARLTAEAEGA